MFSAEKPRFFFFLLRNLCTTFEFFFIRFSFSLPRLWLGFLAILFMIILFVIFFCSLLSFFFSERLLRFLFPISLKGAEAMFGYTEYEAVDQPLVMIIPKRFHDAHRTAFTARAKQSAKSTNSQRLVYNNMYEVRQVAFLPNVAIALSFSSASFYHFIFIKNSIWFEFLFLNFILSCVILVLVVRWNNIVIFFLFRRLACLNLDRSLQSNFRYRRIFLRGKLG